MFISKDIDDFKGSIFNKKSAFNKVHNEVRKKKEILAGLIDKLESLQAVDSAKSEAQALDEKMIECEELLAGLRNENNYNETLKHMAKRIKAENISATQPLIEIRRKLAEIKQENFLIEKVNLQITSAASEINSKYEQDLNTFSTLQSTHQISLSEKSQIFQSRIRLKLSVEREKQRNLLQGKILKDQTRLKSLENKLSDFKKVESLEEEILAFEKFCESEQEKFKTIQKVTNVGNVEDILSHYNFLIGNKKTLLDNLNLSLLQIENLHVTMNCLKEELEELKFKQNDSKSLKSMDLEFVKDKLNAQDKNIEVYESRLEKFEMIIAEAINTFAKISAKLGVHKNFAKLRRENLDDCVKACLNAYDVIKETSKIQEEDSSSESSELSFSETLGFNFY